MGLRQLHTAETMFIDDGLTDGAVFPPSSNAVYDALQNAIELPSVTAEDDGDVLTVVSGAWAKATPSGGGGVLVVSMENENGDYVLDKTWKEIHDAMANGQIAVIYSAVYEEEVELYTNFNYVYQTEKASSTFMVRFFAIEDGDLSSYTFSTDSENGYPTYTP